MGSDCRTTRRNFLVSVGGISLLAGDALESPLSADVFDGNCHLFPPRPETRWSRNFNRVDRMRTSQLGQMYLDGTTITALSTIDGSTLWKFGDYENDGKVVGLTKDAVIVETESTVYVLNVLDGTLRWFTSGDEVLLTTENTVYISQEGISAHSITSGSKRWSQTKINGIWRGLVLSGNRLFAGTIDGEVFALSVDDGSRQWTTNLKSNDTSTSISGSPVRPVATTKPNKSSSEGTTREAFLFVWEPSASTVHVLSLIEGTETWQITIDASQDSFGGTIDENFAYITDERVLRAFDVKDGTERWRVTFGSIIVGSPQVTDNSIYVATIDGVYSITKAYGKVEWSFSNGGKSHRILGVRKRDVIIDSWTDSICVVARDDGSLQWMFDYEGELATLPQFDETGVYVETAQDGVVALERSERTVLETAWKTVIGPYGIVGALLSTAILVGAYRRVLSKKTDETVELKRMVLDFNFQEHLGDGPNGMVDLVRCPEGMNVALKRFSEEDCVTEEFIAALETWASLDHDGILAVHDWGTDPEPWLTMAVAADGDLHDRLDELDGSAAVEFVTRVAEIVHRAHREGVVHGRLHPGNVLFSESEDVLVSDWRLAAIRSECPSGYAAPEQGDNDGTDSVAVDVYQLGCLAVHVLTGESPTEGRFDPDRMPTELVEVLETALSTDPDERYDSALAFRDALRWAAFQA